MTTKTQIVIADPFPVVLSGLRSALGCFVIVGEADDGMKALDLCKVHNPDLLIADYQLPKINALLLAKSLSKFCPKTKLLVLSYDKTEVAAWSCLKAGASGFVSKNQPLRVILNSVNDILAGNIVIVPPLKSSAFVARDIDRLTDRQLEVLQLIAEGMTTKVSARIMNVSPKTVEFHRGKLMETLNTWDIAGLVRFASRNGLISL